MAWNSVNSLLGRCVRSLHCTSFNPSVSWSTRVQARSMLTDAAEKSVKRPYFQDFLAAIGRSSEGKVKVESDKEFWSLDGRGMKEKGVSVQDRRYILWAMEKFRQGEDPERFAHPNKPKKKKIRGRGPAVQHGKRIRSRRHK